MSVLTAIFEFVGFVVCAIAVLIAGAFATGRIRFRRMTAEEWKKELEEDDE